MIDALDHAAQERGNRSAGAWLLVALLGIVLSVAAGMMSYGYMTAQAEQRFADVVDYVATQSLSYDAFNSAYTTKNLIRVIKCCNDDFNESRSHRYGIFNFWQILVSQYRQKTTLNR